MEDKKIDPTDGTQIINRTAVISAETSSFLQKGDKVLVKKFDPKDKLFLCFKDGAGIWLKETLFKFDEEEKKSAFNF